MLCYWIHRLAPGVRIVKLVGFPFWRIRTCALREVRGRAHNMCRVLMKPIFAQIPGQMRGILVFRLCACPS